MISFLDVTKVKLQQAERPYFPFSPLLISLIGLSLSQSRHPASSRESGTPLQGQLKTQCGQDVGWYNGEHG
jgi:hypothetical protein